MNKGVIIKVSVIFGFFAIVFGLAFGCSSIKDNDTTPQLTNGSDTYLTVGDITITNQELWDTMKVSDGLTYLTQYIEEYLLETYIDGVTQTEIDNEITKAIYGTDDADVIAEIQKDPDNEADLVLSYERSLVLMGYDPENDDDVRSYFELQIAKQKYTRDYIEGVAEADSLYISDEDVEDYYVNGTKGDVCAVVVRFTNYIEINAVLDKFNIVPDYEGGLGDYWAATPIDELATGDFSDENTDLLDDQGAFDKYIKLYNYMNPSKTQIVEGTLLEDFCATYGDDFTFEYDEFTNQYFSNENQNTFATYLWTTLSTDTEDEDAKRFSSNVKTIGDFDVLAFKVSEDEITAYADLTQTEKDALYEELLDSKITQANITIAVNALWGENTFEIYEPTLKLQKEFSDGVSYDNNGSKTLVAKLVDGDTTMDITADQLFNYMMDKLGAYYSINMVQSEYLLNSEYYTEVYGDSHDYLKSSNEEMAAHRAELRDMKSIFSSDGYASYGFSSKDFTWDEFLIIAFGSMSESDVIRDLFVVGGLQPNLTQDMISYTRAQDFIQAQVDEYFSLNVEHVLLYLDNDFDFAPDDYKEFTDSLSGADLTTYNGLVVDFEDLIKQKINNDEYTFAEIVAEFQEGLIDDDENDWKEFKAYGFYIMTEDLSPSESLNSSTAVNYDEDFVAALKRIYDDYVTDVEADSTITEYYDDRLVESFFGLHFIYATEGSGFDQPTAVYDNANDSFLPGFVGTTVAPNESQVDLYTQIRFAEDTNKTVDFTAPTSVYAAVTAYYGDIYDAYFTSSAYTIATSSYILDNSPVFTSDQAARISFLESVVGILYEVNFPEEYITPSEDN